MITVIEDKSEHKNENIVRLTEIVFDKCGVGGDLVIKDWDINRIYITKKKKVEMDDKNLEYTEK